MAAKTNGQQAGLTKVEAVRRALDELGKDAKPAAIQPYVKEKFGLDMTPEHITTCKGTILKKAGKGKPVAPKAAAPAAPTSAAPESRAAAAPPKANGKAGGMTKLDAVKQAMAELGPDAMPLAIKDYLKSRLGIEISGEVASTYKKHLKNTGAKPATGKGKPATPRAPAAAPKPAAAKPKMQRPAKAPSAALKPAAPKAQFSAAAPKAESAKPAAGGVSLQDIGTVKDLVGRVGANSLRTLIDLLAR